jgi:photosystem II stability/assembly factor-like uncharacterized protein
MKRVRGSVLIALLLLIVPATLFSQHGPIQRSISTIHADLGSGGEVASHMDPHALRVSRGSGRPRAVTPIRRDATVGQWTLIGPQPLIGPDGKSRTGRMMHSGMINAVAVDPRNSSVVYLGTDGGVWKTTDGGETWIPLTDNQPSLEIRALALDPTSPDIIYAGTAASNSLGGNLGAGILKSTDAGASWTQLPGPLPIGPGLEASIWSLAVSPSDSNILLVVDQRGVSAAVYRSADGGNTWSQVIAPNTAGLGQVLFDPSNGNVAYATLGGVYKSTDGGDTWASANGSGSNALPAGSYFGLGIARSSPSTLFVGALNSTGTQMFKTVDGAQNWTPLPGSPPFHEAIQIDPVNSNIVFTCLWRSMDGGLTWTYLYNPSVAHMGMALSADGNVLYTGGEWGMWKATDLTNSSPTVTDLNATLAITSFFGITVHPTDPAISIGGAASNGEDIYSGTLQWDWVDCDNGGRDAAFDFINPANIYITCYTAPGIEKSTDGGATFKTYQNGIDSSELTPSIPLTLAMDPSNPQRLYLAATHVWQTTNGASSWTAISSALGTKVGDQSLAVAPSDPNTVYLANSAGVYVSTNAESGTGATWANVSAGLPLNLIACNYYGPSCNYLNRIAADPSSASTAYVVFASYSSGHVFKTTDRGGTWTDISGDLPNIKVNDIAVDPDIPNTFYIGTERGVWATSDRGSTWSPLGAGLPNVAVTSLKLQRPTRILRAATSGRSVWDLQLASVSSPVALSATSLAFGTQAGSQTVTLTNAGTAPLTLYGITVSTPFTQSNTCGIQVQSGGTCNLTITFAPTAPGWYSASVSLSDDAPGSPQLIAVSGTGLPIEGDFSVASASPSAAVTIGQSATYPLSIVPEGGFNHTVALACSGAPHDAECSFSPSSVTLNGKDAASAIVTVTTKGPTQVSAHPVSRPSIGGGLRLSHFLSLCGLALTGVFSGLTLPCARRRIRFSGRVSFALLVLLVAVWPACGGNGGGGGTWDLGTPRGTYTLTVSGTYSSGSTILTHSTTLTLSVH